MHIKSAQDFVNQVKAFDIASEYVVVKPNWVSNEQGEYTEPEILDLLLAAFPNQKKIVVESYTPWRGLKFEESDTDKGEGVTLTGGKKHWEFYKKQDKFFLDTTGIAEVMTKHKARYINITNEVWSDRCVKPEIIASIVKDSNKFIKSKELYSYIPQKLYDIRNKATFVSLAKIKIEESIPVIYVSMSVKNLFGLIPHPSRWIPFHQHDHTQIPATIKDVYNIYTSLFKNSIWITEGIKTLVRNYCEAKQKIIKDEGLFFIGEDAIQVDSKTCEAMGINPAKVPHLQM